MAGDNELDRDQQDKIVKEYLDNYKPAEARGDKTAQDRSAARIEAIRTGKNK